MKPKIFVLLILVVFLMGCTQEELSDLNISTEISMEILKTLEPEFESLRNQLDSINKSLWIESEGHYLEVMNTIDNSVVEVRAHPPQNDSDNLNAVIYTDSQGRDWSIGTGFSINKDGHILTAKHVVSNAEIIIIVLKNGTNMLVSVKGIYSYADIAILHVNSGLLPVKFIEGGLFDSGSDIGFIGFPLGSIVRTKTKGSISAVIPYRYKGDNKDTIVYVINSFVNRGNSGGPVFSLKTGEVIGMINAHSEEMNGIAISTSLSKEALPELVY